MIQESTRVQEVKGYKRAQGYKRIQGNKSTRAQWFKRVQGYNRVKGTRGHKGTRGQKGTRVQGYIGTRLHGYKGNGTSAKGYKGTVATKMQHLVVGIIYWFTDSHSNSIIAQILGLDLGLKEMLPEWFGGWVFWVKLTVVCSHKNTTSLLIDNWGSPLVNYISYMLLLTV